MFERLNRLALVESGTILALADAEMPARLVSSDDIDVYSFAGSGVGAPPTSDFERKKRKVPRSCHW